MGYSYEIIEHTSRKNKSHLSFQAIINNNHDCVNVLLSANVVLDEEAMKSCKAVGDDKTKLLMSQKTRKSVRSI